MIITSEILIIIQPLQQQSTSLFSMEIISSTPSMAVISPVNSSTNHEQPPCNKHYRSTILRSLAITFLLLLLLFALTVSIVWLLLHPHLPAVKAESFSFSGLNISNSGFSPTYDVQINITNPNKKINLWIDRFCLRVVYKNNVVVSMVDLLEPYYEGVLIPRDMHYHQFNFPMNTTKLNDKKGRKIVREMRGDWSRGVISFDVMIDVSVKFKSGVFPSKQTLLKVSCRNLTLVFSPTKDFGYLKVGKYCLVGY